MEPEELEAIRTTFGERGAVARLASELDWSCTPLGPVRGWPLLLRSFVRFAMDCPEPTTVFWGEDAIALVNEAATPILRGDLRDVFARSLFESTPELEAYARPVLARVLQGESVVERDRQVPLARAGRLEEAWFDLQYAPIRDVSGEIPGVLMLWHDRTAAVRTARRQQMLTSLAEALRPIADPIEVEAVATRVLGAHLGVTRVMYGKVEPGGEHIRFDRSFVAEGAPEILGRFRMKDFGERLVEALAAGETIALDDIASSAELAAAEREAYAKLGIGALLGVPLVKAGELVANIVIHDAEPRQWTPTDVALVQETAERTWAGIERARVEAALRESEERLQAALVVGKMAHWRWDPSTGHFDASATMDELFGIAPGATFASSALHHHLVHPDDVGEHRAAVEAAIREGRGWHRELRIVRPRDGKIAWLEEMAAPVVSAATGERAIIGLVRDVTERKEVEARVRASEQRALEANRAKDDFLATLGHELRTPLAAILLWAGALRSGAVPLADIARAIDAISESAEAQMLLIDDLLDLSRLSAGRLVLSTSAVDVPAIVRAAVDVVRPSALARGQTLEVVVAPEVGTLVLDGARLKQILWNLLANATKFTPDGGAISVGVERRDASLVIVVADTGEGISAEFLPHVFERFRQADMSETRRHGGWGSASRSSSSSSSSTAGRSRPRARVSGAAPRSACRSRGSPPTRPPQGATRGSVRPLRSPRSASSSWRTIDTRARPCDGRSRAPARTSPPSGTRSPRSRRSSGTAPRTSW